MAALTRTATLPRHPTGRLVVLALILVAVASVAILAMFSWPRSDAPRTRFNVGSVDQFAIGSITRNVEGEFYIVRPAGDEILALSWHDPFSGCTVPWRDEVYMFRDPCHGSVYDYEGRWMSGHYGQQPMRRYDVSLVNGNVIVDSSES
jgi:nitrite reductase/ring-hydroxylating ferredoxin subunit